MPFAFPASSRCSAASATSFSALPARARAALLPCAALTAALVALPLAGPVHAQSAWPAKPVRIVAGFAPGGISDILAPAGTPVAVVNRLNADILKVLAQPEVRDRLTAQGIEIRTSTPAEFAAIIALALAPVVVRTRTAARSGSG